MKIDHITINVSDMARSTAFYCQGLGFEHVDDNHYGNEGAAPVLLEGDYQVHSRHLAVDGGLTLILNCTSIPAEPLPPYRRQYGITNLAVPVDSIEDTIAKLSSLSGTVMENSRASFSVEDYRVNVIICLDPDGQPVELIEASTH